MVATCLSNSLLYETTEDIWLLPSRLDADHTCTDAQLLAAECCPSMRLARECSGVGQPRRLSRAVGLRAVLPSGSQRAQLDRVFAP